MKDLLKKYYKLFIFLVIVIVVILAIIINNIYKDNYLISEVYRMCDNGARTSTCEYYMFKENRKVYYIEQNVDRDSIYNEDNNVEKLLLKHGLDNISKKCDEYGYCYNVLGISDITTGVYSITNGVIEIDWEQYYYDGRYYDSENSYYEINDGLIYRLDSDMEAIGDGYYPVENYNKWKRCKKNNNCDEVFSIDDPLNDIDYNSIYQEIENSLLNRYCKYVMEYTFKDVTGDGIYELLVRESLDGKEFDLSQIYYINTWINALLPLGANSNTSKYDDIRNVYEGGYIYKDGDYYKVSTDGFFAEYYSDSKYDLPSEKSLYEEITDWKSYPKDSEYCEKYE